MKYPLRGDYITAVSNLDKFIFDSILKFGKPVKATNPPYLLRYSCGGKAIVFEIQTNPQKKYALKCWFEDLGDLKVRYKAIDEYLKQIKLPYFIDFSYNEQGILVNGQKYPIIRMEWIDGIDFKKFISNNIENPAYIRGFAEKFLEMMKTLHQNDISHGDLQHGNIMIRQNGDICLIDYDSVYVPKLSNEKDNIKGLPGYQHPNRNKLTKLSPKSDYFSELVIYLSLLAISEKPSFWKNIEKEERLLFSEKDLADPLSSPIFAELAKLSPEIIYFTLELEKFCRQADIELLQPLENLVSAYGGAKIPYLSPPPIIPVDLNNSAWDMFATTSPTKPIVPVDLNSPDWDKLTTTNTTQPVTAKVSASDPWNKFDTNSQNVWDKFDGVQPPSKDNWDKFDQPIDSKPVKPVVVDSIWSKFDKIWNKFLESASSVWNKFTKWFN